MGAVLLCFSFALERFVFQRAKNLARDALHHFRFVDLRGIQECQLREEGREFAICRAKSFCQNPQTFRVGCLAGCLAEADAQLALHGDLRIADHKIRDIDFVHPKSREEEFLHETRLFIAQKIFFLPVHHPAIHIKYATIKYDNVIRMSGSNIDKQTQCIKSGANVV